MGGQLAIGTAMIALCVGLHVGGIIAIITLLRRNLEGVEDPVPFRPLKIARIMIAVVLGIFLLHTIEIWLWATLYSFVTSFETFERALYFSTVTFTTLGYGDIVLEPKWQLLSSLEAANGIILFGISTAFIFTVMSRIFQETGITK